MTARDLVEDIREWEAANLDAHGRYIGRDLAAFGFPHPRGEWVPIDRRYSAMAAHRYAVAAAGQPYRRRLS
jgi:hypothetical protein